MNPVNGTVALHAATPAVAAPFRALAFLRTPSAPEAPARLLVSRTVVHPFSRTTRLFGARALNNTATGNADAVSVSGLAGQPLCLHTADGDAAFTLPDVAGRPLWSCNAQGTVSTAAYEAAGAGGRPLSLTETAFGAAVGRVREQHTYAPLAEAKWQAANLAGSQVELRNNAGISRPLSISLTGQTLAAEQRLLKPEIETPDWATTTPDDTEAPLRIIGTYDATGAPLATTNAAGVTSITDYAINGAVAQTRLAYTEQGSVKEVVTLKDIRYRADGVVLSQTAGNGVIDRYEYDPKTQLLRRHLTERPKGHPQEPLIISDLHYRYDPVGNIISLEDQGADPTWHANRQAIGLREYTYDTLYRLASATGRERTLVARYYGAEASSGSVWAPYSEHYTYDDGNNLTTIRHVGGAGNRTRELQVSEGSNRAVVKGHSLTPETGFLAGGLQKQLADGRVLQWLADNQLGKVTPVSRVDGDDDSERYHYADGGTRTRKVHTVQVSTAMQTTITTYAGGCEVRQRWLAGKSDPQKHIVITEGGDVRVVEDRLTGTVRLRYRFADHLGSVGGEMDAQGRVLAREEYAPYGGTVGCDEAAEEASNLTQRALRYSNKERDATGLYYYGWRYYQAESGRWLSADPGGLIDGINLYGFSRNNPVNLIDTDGRGCTSSKAQRIQEQRDRAAEQEEIERYHDEVTRTIASDMTERMTAMRSTVGEGWSHQWKPGHSEASFKDEVIQLLVGSGETPEQAERLQRRGFALGRREAQDKAASKALFSKASRSTSRHPEPSRSGGISNAITLAWAHDYQNIQKGGSETLYTLDLKNRLKEMNTDPNLTRDRDKWKNTEAGKRALAKVDSLAGKTYAQLSGELNDWVKNNSSMNEGVLYRGVDAEEYTRWIKAGVDEIYKPGRFMASSKVEKEAEKFGKHGGMIHIERGCGADIPNWFGNSDEQEVLFRREAKFKILSIDRSKKIMKIAHVR